MALAKSHGEKKKSDRKAKKIVAVSPSKTTCISKADEYNRADAVVTEIYCDICNGVSRSQVIDKLTEGVYENMVKPIKYRQAVNYYNAALDRFSEDCDIEAEKQRKMFYARYESLLEEAIKRGDLFNAKGIMDSMSRIFGVERKDPKTAIQINSSKENGITVNFGFEKDKKETNE